VKHLLSTVAARLAAASNIPVRMSWSLLLILGLLSAGCATDLHHIYTTGSFRAIPGETTSVFVWAEDPTVRQAVQTWLRGQGLIVLNTTSPRQEAESCLGCERKAALSQARSLKAEQVVLAYSSRNKDPEQLAVSVQGLSVHDEEDVWSGTARKDFPADITGELLQADLTLLSCHALATVWRYRPAGYLSDASKDYCYYHF
jgi:hypothetical protein